MPFAIWCSTCPKPTIIGQGVRFNAEKKKVGNYHSTPIFSFRMKHNVCGGSIEIRTDPKNTAYVVTEGAKKRDTGDEKIMEGDMVIRSAEEREALQNDAFAALEGRVEQKQQVVTDKSRIEELFREKEKAWDDPYAASKKLRKVFRAERKGRRKDEDATEDLKDRMSLGMDLLAETEEDRRRAGFVDFGVVDGETAIMKAKSKPLFTKGLSQESQLDRGTMSKVKLAKVVTHESQKRLQVELGNNTRAAVDPFLKVEKPTSTTTPLIKRKAGSPIPTNEVGSQGRAAKDLGLRRYVVEDGLPAIDKGIDIDIKHPVNQAESAIVDPPVKATVNAAVESDKLSNRSFHSRPETPNMATASDINNPSTVPINNKSAYAPFTDVKADDLATVGRDWIKSLENWDWNRYSQSKADQPASKPQSPPKSHRPNLQLPKKPEALTRRALIENFSDFQMSYDGKPIEQMAQADASSSQNTYKRRFQSSSQGKASSTTPNAPQPLEVTTAKEGKLPASSVQLNEASVPAARLIDETIQDAGSPASNADHHSASKGKTRHHPSVESPKSRTSQTIEPPHHDLLLFQDGGGDEEDDEKADIGAAEDLAGLLFTSVPQEQLLSSPKAPSELEHLPSEDHGLAGLLFDTVPLAAADTAAQDTAIDDTSFVTASEQHYDESLWEGLDDTFGSRVAAPSSAEEAQQDKTSMELIEFDLGDEGREGEGKGKSAVEDAPTNGVLVSPHMRGVQPEMPAAPTQTAPTTRNLVSVQPRSNGTKSSKQQRGLGSGAQTSRPAINDLPTAEELAGRKPVNDRLYTTNANSPFTLIDLMEQSAQQPTGKRITPNDFEFW
ncbi:MAG: hypothetical protein Q9174_002177 [Haloplaca sp. 1 TL-2023]